MPKLGICEKFFVASAVAARYPSGASGEAVSTTLHFTKLLPETYLAALPVRT